MAIRHGTRTGWVSQGVAEAIQRSQAYLMEEQYDEGYWWGELESNPTMEAEYLLMTYFLEQVNAERWRKLTNQILRCQREDGSWGQYYQAPGDVSTSVECYFALKLAGVSPDRAEMRKARAFILSRGGVPATRIFTKIWLSLFDQWDWRGTPVMPPELIFLPKWFPVNIYDFSSWARATIVPMMIILSQRPNKMVPPEASIDELYPVPRDQVDYSLAKPPGTLGWAAALYWLDRLLRIYESLPIKPARNMAVRRSAQWVLEHQEADGSWGGIQPPWVYSLIALKHLGYSNEHPAIQKGLDGFEAFTIIGVDACRVQACISPVWDTCLVLLALQESGLGDDHPAADKATRWLISQQIRKGGDWQVKNRRAQPGGWAFEFHNDSYPDIDDAAEVLIALNNATLPGPEDAQRREAVQLGVEWVLSMQSKEGGWAAFDKDNTKSLIAKIPFADFGETLDPPSADVTAHVLEMLGKLGYARNHPAVERGYKYLRKEQEQEGPWFGRWGVNYIYGTAAVLMAMEAIGEDMNEAYIRRAVDWIAEKQNEDGGWGETCGSYVDFSMAGVGPSTPSQTAWAILGLMAAGEVDHPATVLGAEYLVKSQQEEGCWDEPYYTGTGFPGYGTGKKPDRLPEEGERGHQGLDMSAGFMINYHMYRNCWPLMALGRYRRLTALTPTGTKERIQ